MALTVNPEPSRHCRPGDRQRHVRRRAAAGHGGRCAGAQGLPRTWCRSRSQGLSIDVMSEVPLTPGRPCSLRCRRRRRDGPARDGRAGRRCAAAGHDCADANTAARTCRQARPPPPTRSRTRTDRCARAQRSPDAAGADRGVGRDRDRGHQQQSWRRCLPISSGRRIEQPAAGAAAGGRAGAGAADAARDQISPATIFRTRSRRPACSWSLAGVRLGFHPAGIPDLKAALIVLRQTLADRGRRQSRRRRRLRRLSQPPLQAK